MKKLDVAGLDVSGKVETIEHIFDNMHVKSEGLGQAGFLLGGDTGVGKTSFVRELAAILGMELIIIETPHIVEEHIIDIPFIVVKPSGESRAEHMHVDTKGSQKQFDVTFAKSHLYKQLVAARAVPDAELLKAVQSKPELKLLWEKLGGSDTKIPSEIKKLRAKYKAILFLDEYFRQTSQTIRNMLRSILNGRIGSNPLPDDVYVIFASNLIDQGVGDILENEDFRIINFDTPKLDEWFAYMAAKYKNHPKVKMTESFLAHFYELMNKNKGSLSLDDVDADVRVSPRRWEQLLVYIAASLPVKDEKQAARLLKNVEINFRHYQTGDKAAIAKDVIDTVTELINEGKKKGERITASPDDVSNSDWRDTLKHQIETRIKAGESRKYIPVIGGVPGAGKTRYITELANDLNLVPVFVDVQNLSPEEVLGVPLAEDTEGEDIKVGFSRPPLWQDIQQQIKAGEANLKQRLERFLSADEAAARLKKFKSQEIKYLIFFDELNRTNTKVFNAIRKILLEKEFSDEYKLPKDAIIVAAINPTGKGTQELTKHVRDVFDVIPVGVSWAKFSEHLKKLDLKVGAVPNEIARSALKAFVEHFRVKSGAVDDVDSHFYLNVGSSPVYISAREYTDMLVNLARSIERAYDREVEKMADPEHDVSQSEMVIRRAMARSMIHTIEYVIKHKGGIDAPEFISDLEEWILHTDKISMGDAFKKKVESVKNLSTLLDRPFKNMDEDLFNDLEFVNYITSVDPVVFKEELTEFLVNSVHKDIADAFAKDRKSKVLGADNKTKIEKEEITKLEYIIREIIHAIKLHNVTPRMTEMVIAASQSALRQLSDMDENNDFISEVIKLAKQIRDYIKKMNIK